MNIIDEETKIKSLIETLERAYKEEPEHMDKHKVARRVTELKTKLVLIKKLEEVQTKIQFLKGMGDQNKLH